MARARRVYLASERRELWERWRRGESISEIGRALDRAPGTIFTTLKEHRGITPRERRRSRLALTLVEREEISRGISLSANLAGRSLVVWAAPRRRSAERSLGTAGGLTTAPQMPTGRHGAPLGARRAASSR